MRTRIAIIQDLVAALRRIDGGSSPWDRNYSFNYDLHGDVYFGYSEDQNSFPLINILIDEENIYSIGGGERFSNIILELRCFTYDENVTESAEALVQDVEAVLDAYRLWAPHLEDVRVAQIETDGGINAPYGISIIKVQVLFRR